eukprot:scaffold629_cov168-Amphora_coffeaeformis.AAC.4
MEVVDDALQELKKEAEDPEAEYERLTKDEMEDYREFEEEADILYEHKWNVHDSVTAMELYRDHTYCHTANIPAQTRYLGHVYNENVSDDWFQYYHGQTLKFLRQRFPGPELSLTYIPKQRDTKYNCNHTLHIDSKDFFLATGRYDGYQTLVWPNDAEVKAYGEHVPKGIIAACASSCSFECGASPLLNADAIHSGKATFRVNGEDVDSVIPFENCFLFVRKDGSLHWPNNGSNQYELGVQVVALAARRAVGEVIQPDTPHPPPPWASSLSGRTEDSLFVRILLQDLGFLTLSAIARKMRQGSSPTAP